MSLGMDKFWPVQRGFLGPPAVHNYIEKKVDPKTELHDMRAQWGLPEQPVSTDTGGRTTQMWFTNLLFAWLSLFQKNGGVFADLPPTPPPLPLSFISVTHRLSHKNPDKNQEIYFWVESLVSRHKKSLEDAGQNQEPASTPEPDAQEGDPPGPPSPVKKKKFSPDYVQLFLDVLKRKKVSNPKWGIGQTIAYFSEVTPGLFEGLSLDTAKKWNKRSMIQKETSAEISSRSRCGKRRRRDLQVGEFDDWNAMKVPTSILMTISGLIMSHVHLGIPLTVPLVSGLCIGVLEASGVEWRPSRSWVRTFLGRIGLSYRERTTDPGSLPRNSSELSEMFSARLVFVVTNYNISPDLCFNMDEMSMALFPTMKKTWAQTGGKSVKVQGAGDKRCFTLSMVVDAAGCLVGNTQCIWAGKTVACEPDTGVKSAYAEWISHTHTTSHWSTPASVELLVDDLYNKHVIPTLEKKKLNIATTYWLMIWDVFYAHRGDILQSLKTKYPTLIILFVPARCTNILQPLDISFNAHFKRIVRKAANQWLIDLVRSQIDAGKSGEDVEIPFSLSLLKLHFCSWIAEGVKWGRSQDSKQVILAGWKHLMFVWDVTQRASMFARATEMNRTGTLWTLPPKEHPIVPHADEIIYQEEEKKEESHLLPESDDHTSELESESDSDVLEEESDELDPRLEEEEEEKKTQPHEFLDAVKGYSRSGRAWFVPARFRK